jgi:hypothetical protein
MSCNSSQACSKRGGPAIKRLKYKKKEKTTTQEASTNMRDVIAPGTPSLLSSLSLSPSLNSPNSLFLNNVPHGLHSPSPSFSLSLAPCSPNPTQPKPTLTHSQSTTGLIGSLLDITLPPCADARMSMRVATTMAMMPVAATSPHATPMPAIPLSTLPLPLISEKVFLLAGTMVCSTAPPPAAATDPPRSISHIARLVARAVINLSELRRQAGGMRWWAAHFAKQCTSRGWTAGRCAHELW